MFCVEWITKLITIILVITPYIYISVCCASGTIPSTLILIETLCLGRVISLILTDE